MKRKLSRYLSTLLAVCMLLTMAGPSVFALRGDNYDENGFYTDGDTTYYEPAEDSDGDGYYEIDNAGKLFWFAALVNGETSQEGISKAVSDANAVLTGDIAIPDGYEWTPIGNRSSSASPTYKGTFDGNGKTISGLSVNSSSDCQGLFGYVLGGTVKNVTLSGSVIGGNKVGGIVGYNVGGTITGVTVDNVTVRGTQYVGGAVGYSTGVIKEVAVNATVTGSGSNVGGVVGILSSGSSVEGCSFSGKVTGGTSNTGGIAGQISKNCSVTYSYNTGTVTGGSGNATGGIAGMCSGTISNCYNRGSITSGGGDRIGGICGYASAATVTYCYSSGLVTSSGSCTGGVCGFLNGSSDSQLAACYYDSTVNSSVAAVGYGSSTTLTDVEAKTTDAFESGEVTYLLNEGVTDGTQAWYQNLDNGEPEDTYPVLDDTHGTVYAVNETYSNSMTAAEETFTVNYVYPDGSTANLEKEIKVGSDDCYDSDNGSYDLTKYVPDGYLYGGLYTDDSCETEYASDEQCGVSFVYEEDDTNTYYIRLVSDRYFQTKCLWAASSTKLVNVWPVIGVDCTDYTEIGISINGTDTPMDTFDEESSGEVENGSENEEYGYAVYESVTITYPGGDPERTTVTCEEQFGVEGYLGVYQGLDVSELEDDVIIRPYFVTLDGVEVYGSYQRTVSSEDSYPFIDVQDEEIGTDTEAYGSGIVVISVLTVGSNYTLQADLDTTDTYTITKYEDGVAYTQEVDADAEDVEVTYKGKEGYLFAGWYTDEAYTTAADFSEITGDMTVYAKYVSDDYLCVKCSKLTSKNALTGIRVISAVDCKNYAEVGFVYEYGGDTTTVQVKKYTSSISGVTATKMFGGDVVSGSKIIYNDLSVKSMDAGTEIKITPYWITLDGTTVYGTSRTLTYTGSDIE